MASVDIGLGASGANAQQVHAGPNVQVCRISISATTSAGDVLRIGKLPHGAIPTDCVFYPGPAFAAGIWKFGISASDAAFIASATLSTVTRGNVGLSWQLSLSSDARVLFDYITGTPSAAVTVGHHGHLVVQYVMPGQNP